MRIVLFNSCSVSKTVDTLQRSEPHPRIGIASIAAYLRMQGHDVRVLDPQLEQLTSASAVERIGDADLVGFPSHTEEINDAADIAAAVKERNPRCITVVGGYHVSAIPEDTLQEFKSFDYGVVGEGEIPLAEIAEGKPPEAIAGLAYREATGGQIRVNAPRREGLPMDALPPPAWDLFNARQYTRGLPVEMVRCCPFTCSFCFKPINRNVRYKPAERALQEIEEGMRTYGARRFYFVSSGTFPLKKQHAMEICNGIVERGLHIQWSTATRVDLLDEELVIAMKKSGCTDINIGIESGDPQLLAQSQKGITLEMAEDVIKMCHRLGMSTELNFILGLPFETEQTLANTRRFLVRLRPYSLLANFAILVPFPGTRVYEMALRHEGGLCLKTRDWRLYSKAVGAAVQHDHFTQAELRRHQARLYFAYYAHPMKVLQMLRNPIARELISPRRFVALLRALMS